ncbi:MAG: hypothetical protein KatS3mg104_2110 [Phycisphaerae bacterium]|nr:MAG: hypothetical protein KatS3mg104_2110 [Phycisphaerae bacterium]
MDDLPLRRLTQWKKTVHRSLDRLGDEVVEVFKTHIQKRQTRLGKIAEAWLELVPDPLQEFTHLGGFARGTLTVIVEGSANLYLLKQAMLAGLEDQLLLACRGQGLRKINLRLGKTPD